MHPPPPLQQSSLSLCKSFPPALAQAGISSSTELVAELLAFCKEHLATFKCPRSIDFSEKLPRLDNGKLYKQGLREQYRAAIANK
jgi:acyl-coenzyme A synthetase/AMP-(fatty) acid ligase